MADKLEEAVLLQFDQSPNTPFALKTQAATYIENLKTDPESWKLFIEQFTTTSFVEVKFWCLQALTDTLPRRHPLLSPEDKLRLREVLLSWILDPRVHSQPPLVRNKLAQAVTAIVRLEYPKLWPSFFTDLISSLQQGHGVVDMFCRVFLAIDSDIISQDIHHSVQDQKISVQLKDAMRESCIKEVVEAWYNLVVMYHTTDPALTALVLSTLQKYIGWMSVGLVVNNKFMPLIFDLLKTQQDELQEASIECLNEILLKGMEPSEKIHFIQKMGIVSCCSSWKDGLPGEEGDDLREKCAKLLTTLCSEILECCKRIENSCISMRACKLDIKSSVKSEANQICKTCEMMLEELFPAVIAVLRTAEDAVCMAVIPFVNTFVLRLKHFQERAKNLPDKELTMLRSILQGALLAARYPQVSEIPPSGQFTSTGQKTAADEEMEMVSTKRSELFTIFKNIARISSDLVISSLLVELQNTLHNTQAPFQDVEILLTAVFEMGEACSQAMQQPGCGPLASLVVPFLQMDIPNNHHQIISIALLELYGRYYRVSIQSHQDLPRVLSSFIGQRGMLHTSQVVSDRACYLFMRFVKSCRGTLKPYVMSILDSLSEFFGKILTTPRPQSSPENTSPDPRLYVFEAAGLLLGIEDLDPTRQQEAVVTMISPAVSQMEGILQQEVEDMMQELVLVQSLEMVSRMSKGFKNEQVTTERPELGRVFVKCLELSLKIPLSTKSRLVELLGELTLPYLHPAFEALLHHGVDLNRAIELVTLSHQLVTNLGPSLGPFLRLILPVLFQQIYLCLREDWDWSGHQQRIQRMPGKTEIGSMVVLDETREKENLQRLYYGLIYAIFTHGNGLLFLELSSSPFLEMMLISIQKGASSHVDIPTRRLCIQVFQQLVEAWSEKIRNDANLKQFVMVQIGHEICVLKILFHSNLDCRDAATNALFQDIAQCLKSIFSVCGNEFIKTQSDLLLDKTEIPSGLVLELLKSIQNANIKELKDFYKKVAQALANR